MASLPAGPKLAAAKKKAAVSTDPTPAPAKEVMASLSVGPKLAAATSSRHFPNPSSTIGIRRAEAMVALDTTPRQSQVVCKGVVEERGYLATNTTPPNTPAPATTRQSGPAPSPVGRGRHKKKGQGPPHPRASREPKRKEGFAGPRCRKPRQAGSYRVPACPQSSARFRGSANARLGNLAHFYFSGQGRALQSPTPKSTHPNSQGTHPPTLITRASPPIHHIVLRHALPPPAA